MSENLVERYRRWFEYEKDAHEKVLESLKSVPESKWTDLRFQKAIDLFCHIIGARWLWLHRFGATVESPDELFPTNVTQEELASRLAKMHDAWSKYFGQLDDAKVSHEFEYQSSEGPHYRNRVEDLLTQLFGHSWYHRGQIAAIVRSLGGTPAETDFVFWTREPVESSTN